MIPVLIKFTFDSLAAQVALYLAALALIAYGAWSGWRGAVGPEDKKSGTFAPPTREQRITRIVIYAVIAGAIAKFGLYYALPATAFLGGKGEGFPIHTYGVMLALGFVFAVTLASRMAQKEWPGEEGL